MLDMSTCLLFLGASMALTIAPGPDNLFVITQGITRGRKAALLTTTGMIVGVTVHTTAAALGISAILYSSDLAFRLLQYAGAAYLFFLAVMTFLHRNETIAFQTNGKNKTALEMFGRGFLMNVLNPKVALFFLAFLPQFVNPDEPHRVLQMFQLGLIFMLQGFLVFGSIAMFTGAIGNAMKKHASMQKGLSLLAMCTYIGLGLKIALEQR